MKLSYNNKYPLKHLSIRVPWHDNVWNGTVCSNPKNNSACLVLKNCALNRNDIEEETLANTLVTELTEENYPACVNEGGLFMNSSSIPKTVSHPYTKNNNPVYKHFQPTTIQYAPYTVPAIPFYWMLPDNVQDRNGNGFANYYHLNFSVNREPYKRFQNVDFSKNWIQEYENQKSILDCFFEHVKPTESLSFFYAKEVPFVESSGRVLVGIGKITEIVQSEKYNVSTNTGFDSMPWEHIVHHTIRPDFKDGFIFPYHEAMKYQENHPDFNIEQLAVIVPIEQQLEFSFKTEHVSNDTALYVLRESIKKMELFQKYQIGKDHNQIIDWLQIQIRQIEKLRGDYPGLGSALFAFGFDKGHFIAQHIFNSIQDTECPWKYLLIAMKEPKKYFPEYIYKEITDENLELFKQYVTNNNNRLKLLQLISRFALSEDQAIYIFDETERRKYYQLCTDVDLLHNPYLIYEISIRSIDPISFYTIDIGLMLNRDKELLPDKNKRYNPLSKERIRALTIMQLENLSNYGHTLYPESDLISKIKELPIDPVCNLNADYFNLASSIFDNKIVLQYTADNQKAYQLKRYNETSDLIGTVVKKRIQGKRHTISVDWNAYLEKEIRFEDTVIDIEAKIEKAKALEELSNSRFSVLIGQAGSGKTTLLSVLASIPDIQRGNVLFLAPTGKARVRMEEHAKKYGVTTKTIAQFLYKSRRFDGRTQTYQLKDNENKESGFKTVIIDECSMLTEEMLAATLQNLDKVERLILVGDYRQLPPIGAGRPFFDIIEYIKSEGKSYVELTLSHRQKGEDRLDKEFAALFGGKVQPENSEKIIDDILQGKSKHIQFYRWNNESSFEKLFYEVLENELGIHDSVTFNRSIGATDDGNYFNYKQAVEKIEDWQLLSPVKSKIFGTTTLNRFIHQKYKTKVIQSAYNRYRIPKPMGTEEIVYGDKVINLINHERTEYTYPKDGSNYIANGEVGIVVGKFAKQGEDKPKYIQVEFSSQKGYTYSFKSNDFGEESGNLLELAYSLTVHKAQGSQFKIVLLVLPNPCFLLSRELLYTALTRQIGKVVILYQGHPQELFKYTNDYHSNTLERITNLFYKPNITVIKDKFFERNLIHCTSDGKMLRSKSELIIYETLLRYGIKVEYEYKLEINGEIKRPDFYIVDDDSSIEYFWEHLGMLNDSKYEEDWNLKKEWYKKNGITENGGDRGTLIVTDEIGGAISVKKIVDIIKKTFGVKEKQGVEKDINDLLLQTIKKLRDDFDDMKSIMQSFSKDIADIKQQNKDKEEILELIYKNLDKTISVANLQTYYDKVNSEYPFYPKLHENSYTFLASAYYLKDKLDEVSSEDYSPFVLQFSRSIENEILTKVFLTFYNVLNTIGQEELSGMFQQESKNTKTSVFAKMLEKKTEKFTLGNMETILGFIWKESGDTLKTSILLQKFREHTLTVMKSDFLSKETVQALNRISQNYRNKSAHIEKINRQESEEFLEISKSFLLKLIG